MCEAEVVEVVILDEEGSRGKSEDVSR